MAKFNKGELFCEKCLIHDHFFKGGGSWSPDGCPECNGTACKTYESLSFFEKRRARSIWDDMWEKRK